VTLRGRDNVGRARRHGERQLLEAICREGRPRGWGGGERATVEHFLYRDESQQQRTAKNQGALLVEHSWKGEGKSAVGDGETRGTLRGGNRVTDPRKENLKKGGRFKPDLR